jgi:lipopolysaccharide export system protein LptC
MTRTRGLTIISLLMFGSLFVAAPAFAQTAQNGPQGAGWSGRMDARPGVFGSVTAVSGSTLTVQSKGFGPNATQTTYAVDASNATVTKNGSASSLGNVSVGDTVMVQGTVSGTNVAATAIRDGMPQGMRGMRGMKGGAGQGERGWGHASTTPPIQGNGQPVVGGSVTAVSGSTLTVATKAGATYSVNASSATIVKNGSASSLGNVSVGDNVVVQGAVNGTSITASSVMDSGAQPAASSNTGANAQAPHRGSGGFLGGIGNFFHNLFGFF